ncbi:hypothetical protein B4U79_15394 [Dinothrombium tinctorium]|uniref:Uncharacterized protein n=1 Tax=Dinothrombium tinctorium TaxID=1965070 RepID=A0A3S3Q546_9ACAR|nr:hypothetical protein B4U79_15394 [Dinothrombium tinctorium]
MAERSLEEEIRDIPLVDEDAQDESDDNETTDTHQNDAHSRVISQLPHPNSIESISGCETPTTGPNSLDPDLSPDEGGEKERLIQQVLELQNTLDGTFHFCENFKLIYFILEDLSQRVDTVKEENLKLKSENQVLGQYIENLMSASSVFQSTSPKAAKKKGKK